MFFPISSPIPHNFIREKNDKRRYCFYYKCICSHIQLVLLFPCLLFLFSPQPCAGSACLSIPRILGKALMSIWEVHHSGSCRGPAEGTDPAGREQRWDVLLHLCSGVPGASRCPEGCVPCRCRVRVIDTFGTEPAYNHEEYATLRGYRTNWGYWNLQPAQFMTMFREWGCLHRLCLPKGWVSLPISVCWPWC